MQHERKTEREPQSTIRQLFLELPPLPAHGTQLLSLSLQPLDDTVHMETVSALSGYCSVVWELRVHVMMSRLIYGAKTTPFTALGNSPSGQSSPGILQSGQHPSNGRRHMPHSTSSFASQCQAATAIHDRTLTFILLYRECACAV